VSPAPELTALERRYRRLLRCYPPSHRAAHREEMLGVLLATARPGQRVPSASQTLNLVACGLAIRARRALTTGPWRDALAVVSLIGPALMLVIAALNLAVTTREVVAIDQVYPPAVPFWRLGLVPLLSGPAAVLIGWLAVVLLSVAGRRRTAAAVASVPLALTLASLLADVLHWAGAWTGGLPEFLSTAGLVGGPAVLASLAVCSLAFSAGPRRGLAIAGKRRACLMIAGLSAGFGFPSVIYLVSRSVLAGPASSALSVLAIVVAGAITRVRGAAGGWVAVLVATALLIDLGPFAGDLTANLLHLLGGLLVAVIAGPLALAWKRKVSRA
jgi:hypothetical protein